MNPTQKQAQLSVQTDPIVLWNGWSGPVEIAGMRFEVEKMEMPDDRLVKVVKVLAAPAGTELSGIGGSGVYVTLAQLYSQEFQSRLREGSTKWVQQKRIWDFLHGVFVAAGIKTKPQTKSAVSSGTTQSKRGTSASIEGLIAGTLGVYCFNEQAPRAVFEVRGTRARTGTSLVVELVSIEHGHQIYDYCRKGTYLFHDTLSKKHIPDFRGERAGDTQKMWEFLTDIIAEYRGLPAAVMQPRPCSIAVDYHGNA